MITFDLELLEFAKRKGFADDLLACAPIKIKEANERWDELKKVNVDPERYWLMLPASSRIYFFTERCNIPSLKLLALLKSREIDDIHVSILTQQDPDLVEMSLGRIPIQAKDLTKELFTISPESPQEQNLFKLNFKLIALGIIPPHNLLRIRTGNRPIEIDGSDYYRLSVDSGLSKKVVELINDGIIQLIEDKKVDRDCFVKILNANNDAYPLITFRGNYPEAFAYLMIRIELGLENAVEALVRPSDELTRYGNQFNADFCESGAPPLINLRATNRKAYDSLIKSTRPDTLFSMSANDLECFSSGFNFTPPPAVKIVEDSQGREVLRLNTPQQPKSASLIEAEANVHIHALQHSAGKLISDFKEHLEEQVSHISRIEKQRINSSSAAQSLT